MSTSDGAQQECGMATSHEIVHIAKFFTNNFTRKTVQVPINMRVFMVASIYYATKATPKCFLLTP